MSHPQSMEITVFGSATQRCEYVDYGQRRHGKDTQLYDPAFPGSKLGPQNDQTPSVDVRST